MGNRGRCGGREWGNEQGSGDDRRGCSEPKEPHLSPAHWDPQVVYTGWLAAGQAVPADLRKHGLATRCRLNTDS
jgi:hypothetical protein